MKSFREILENKIEDYDSREEDQTWTKFDLIDLIQEQELDSEDIEEITELVLEIASYNDFINSDEDEWYDDEDWDDDDGDEDEIYEKMSAQALRKAAKLRRKPAYKKAARLRKKCQAKYKERIKSTKGSNTPMVCGNDGKLHKGMKKIQRRKMAKIRKKNKSRIIK